MHPVLVCLDSGTTAVKAAAFDENGRMIASAERANGALRREGLRVEQDMEVSRGEAFAVLRACTEQINNPVSGCVITGQGDGLWPVDGQGQPVGRAITWLDARSARLAAELDPELDVIQAATGSRPTAAAQSLQLLWMQQNDPARFGAIAHALRLKEWLFLSLTGRVMAEPSAVLPVWGSWRKGEATPLVQEALGLRRGIELLPELTPIESCRANLSPSAAAVTGFPAGVPVLLGTGDVQATLIGLGLGSRSGVTRASIFGTSAIHACLATSPDEMRETPSGAMVQRFALDDRYLCFHPSFNGATVLQHLHQQFAAIPRCTEPHYSALVLHPFFEPGGERAPWTDLHARGAVLGLTAAAHPREIAWAAREALAFVARKSHEMMDASSGTLALGGGLAADKHFARFLATTLRTQVERSPSAHAGLRGLAALG
uniref:FGGY family carbohydrate kinase n=1 Tax=uncultured Paracoccus sp. TaxID=189685 RepID=UPI00260184E3